MQFQFNQEDQNIKISNSNCIYRILLKVLLKENRNQRQRQHFWVIGLDDKHKIKYIELLRLGDINYPSISPMDVFSFALQQQVDKIIFTRNEPSSILEPKEEDKKFTEKMLQIGKILNLQVLDHLIIDEKSYYSYDDEGLMADLENSKENQIDTLKQEWLKKEFYKAGLQKGKQIGFQTGVLHGKKEKTLEMVKSMQEKGIDLSLIVEISGLPKVELKKLYTNYTDPNLNFEFLKGA